MLLSATIFLLGIVSRAQAPSPYGPPNHLCTLDAKYLDEVSGIADSRTNPGTIWLHNDSGDRPFLYGVDHKKGKTVAIFYVTDAQAIDWEDMAIGPGPDGQGNFLYLGDIGDNRRQRPSGTVYRIAEPKLPDDSGTRKSPHLTRGKTIQRVFVYPDGAHNAEALLCHPKTGDLYIVTKEESGISGVYRFPKETSPVQAVVTLERVGTVTIPEENHPFPRLVTSGDISPDGKRVALQTYDAAYELRLPSNATSFDLIWKQKLTRITTATMQQAEAICYSADGTSLLETSEKRPTPIYRLPAHYLPTTQHRFVSQEN